MRRLLAGLLVLAPAFVAAADTAGPVRLEKTDAAVEISIGGEPFAVYQFQGYEKPFLAPLRTAGGIAVTRSLDKQAVTDHPHHKGLWVGVDEVNGNRHWMEAQPVRTKSVEVVTAEGDPAVLKAVHDWIGKDGKPVLTETDTISIFSDRLVAYDMALTPPGDEPVHFGDTKEGFFAVRLRDELRGKGGTGTIVNADGARGEKEAWGRTAAWVDYSGTVDGKPAGVAVFDHPRNVRKGRYHVRDYGLFAVSPFGEKAYTNGANEANEITLKPGETLRLRYAAFVHDGDTESADIASRYRKYVETAKD